MLFPKELNRISCRLTALKHQNVPFQATIGTIASSARVSLCRRHTCRVRTPFLFAISLSASVTRSQWWTFWPITLRDQTGV